MLDYDEWYQHFKDLRDGYVQPHHMGRYVVGTGKRNRQLTEMEAHQKEIEMREQQRPVVNQIAPVAKAIEERKKEGSTKRKKAKTTCVLAK